MNWSKCLLVSSVGGISVTHVGEQGASAYSISKPAVHHLGRNLVLELAPRNITTNVIAPGWFPTRLANPVIDHYGGLKTAGTANPMGRLGVPEDIAGVVIYLCSKAGSYVNGQDITLDGGKRLVSRSWNSGEAGYRGEAKL